MEKRRLGNGPEVGAIGFGCMGMSEFYGATDDEASLATLDSRPKARSAASACPT